jgi:hypothetical protein
VQKLKQLSEQRAVIKRLNIDLEVEQLEKVQLQEELRQQREKAKKLCKFFRIIYSELMFP